MIVEKGISREEKIYENEEYQIVCPKENGVFIKNQYSIDKEKVTDMELFSKFVPIMVSEADDDRITLIFYNEKELYYNVIQQDGKLILDVIDHVNWWRKWISFHQQFSGIRVEAKIPKEYVGNIKVHNQNGSVSMDHVSIQGTVLLHTNNSGITITNTKALRVEADTSNNRVFMSKSTGEEGIMLYTSNSSIEVRELISNDISLETSNASVYGSILGKEEEYEVTSRTTNSSSNLPSHWGKGEKKLRVITCNSSIEIQFLPR